jgi:clan AA aspartic protease (TIGR02281 family)
MTKYSFDPEDPVLALYVEIKGDKRKAKPKLALDTGSTYTMIPWELAEFLGYEPHLCKERVRIITASGIEKTPLITLESVGILDKTATNIKAVVHDLPPESYADGLLGLSFLRKFRFVWTSKKGY